MLPLLSIFCKPVSEFRRAQIAIMFHQVEYHTFCKDWLWNAIYQIYIYIILLIIIQIKISYIIYHGKWLGHWCIKVKYWAIICLLCKPVFFDIAHVVIRIHTYQSVINLATTVPLLN